MNYDKTNKKPANFLMHYYCNKVKSQKNIFTFWYPIRYWQQRKAIVQNVGNFQFKEINRRHQQEEEISTTTQPLVRLVAFCLSPFSLTHKYCDGFAEAFVTFLKEAVYSSD